MLSGVLRRIVVSGLPDLRLCNSNLGDLEGKRRVVAYPLLTARAHEDPSTNAPSSDSVHKGTQGVRTSPGGKRIIKVVV